ncbi:Hypothetical protein SMAX5B_016193 [Scophthalmus maximus]|uniref:Uncharacterized protein n=1 Tax=Scophthalmus maximus TaxID=52904 RepID=A0A2U9BLL2_SCOMX|nr:Hypothetical protein SMAX5B_016193 [Scophthalmus maximus]
MAPEAGCQSEHLCEPATGVTSSSRKTTRRLRRRVVRGTVDVTATAGRGGVRCGLDVSGILNGGDSKILDRRLYELSYNGTFSPLPPSVRWKEWRITEPLNSSRK